MHWQTLHPYRPWVALLTLLLCLLGLIVPHAVTANVTPLPYGPSVPPNNGRNVWVSNNGRWIAYRASGVVATDTMDLLLIDSTDPTLTPKLIDKHPVQGGNHIQFSPSDRYLLYENGIDLYVYDLKTSENRHISSGLIGLYQFTPDEQYLLVIGHPEIHSVPLDGSTPIRLTPPDLPNRYTVHVAISPDSRYVLSAYSAYTDTEEGYVVIAPISATGSIALREYGFNFGTNAQFSANGERAYFLTRSQLRYIDTKTLEAGTIFAEGGYTGILDSSPDHEHFLIVWQFPDSNVRQLMRIRSIDGSVESIIATSNTLRFLLSPVDNRLVYTELITDHYNIGTLIYDPIESAHILYKSPKGVLVGEFDYQFNRDNTQVVFKDTWNELYAVLIDGSTPATKLLNVPVGQYRLSPDSDSVWVTLLSDSSDDIAYVMPSGERRTVYHGDRATHADITLVNALHNEQLLFRVRGAVVAPFAIQFEIADPIPGGNLIGNDDWLAEGMSTMLTVTMLPTSTVPLTFTFSITGSVDPDDVQIDPAVVTIPPGETEAIFTVTHRIDNEVETPQMAVVELVPSEVARVGSHNTVTIPFVDDIYFYYLTDIKFYD